MEEDIKVIDEWRAAHRHVLNTFQAILRTRTRGKNIYVAQRHKRLNTILDKLQRIGGMQLVRMDDVAGCRLIFESVEQLNLFRSSFHKARFKHNRRNDSEKYNYIAKPKSTGYRGIHDVYEYNVNSFKGRALAGMYVEIQYRTRIQHAWATANEIIGITTPNQPKFQRGDATVIRAMALASEILSRSHEKMLGPVPEISDNRALVNEFLKLDDELNLVENLRNLAPRTQTPNQNKKQITILNIYPNTKLVLEEFKNEIDAIRRLFELEKSHPNNDVVLVRARTSDEVRFAFRNYFHDAQEFIHLIESGCAELTGSTNKHLPRALRLVKGTRTS